MPSCDLFGCRLPLPKKTMKANPRFPLILEKYRAHLRSEGVVHLSLFVFCKQQHVNPNSVTQWMRRHGITTSTLECELLVEQFGSDAENILAELESKRRPMEVSVSKRKSSIPVDNLMRCVSVTFPDGLQVNIRETTPSALLRFLDAYNLNLDQSSCLD